MSWPADLPPMPPQPPGIPGTGPDAAMERWLRTPRRGDALGIYAYGHQPKPPLDPNRIGDRRLIGQAVAMLIAASVVYSLYRDYLYLGSLWLTPLDWLGLVPHTAVWTWTPGQVSAFNVSVTVYNALCVALIVALFGRAGGWLEVIRRYLLPRLLPLLRRLRHAATDPGTAAGSGQPADPAQWPHLRAASQDAAADRLTADLQAGQMTDVDYTRISRAWTAATVSDAGMDAFTKEVLRQGAAAYAHPSGTRDLPTRTATHDVLRSQVRIGLATDEKRTPYEYRGTPIALEPAVLRTGLLAVGPPGAGKTRRLVRPVVESLCLQALAGTAAVAVVAAAGTDLGSPDAFDVIISLGDPSSAYDLDLYGTTDPDEAAGILAEALAGEDADRGTIALAQLLGPYWAAHGRFPGVTELRELLDGAPAAYAALRDALDEAGAHGYIRDLDARQRQADRPGDIGTLLADRIALLDRSAFAGFFNTADTARQFTLRALEHPLRVRIDLPARGHTEASRVLARLLLAQYTAAITTRPGRSPFACLVLDDASHTLTTGSVRALQHLRSANAGVLLALRTLDDVPEHLRSTLLSAIGCPVALAGVTTWDGKHFAQAWGTTWVEESDVTRAPDQSGGALRRATRGIRKAVTGEAVTTEAVTVRKVERQRWSASDLAHTLPPGHAVMSLSHTDGRHTPPLLVDLRA